MLLRLKLKVMLVVFAVCFFPAMVAFGATSSFNGQINAENINLRVDATVSSAVICNLSKGQIVEVVAEAYDWYKIRLPKEAPSYVKQNLLECINSDPVTNPGKCSSAKVIKNRINIRLGPSESSWVLGKADKLTILDILAKENGWYKIQPVYQSYGWVNKKFVSKEIILPKKQEAIEPPVKVTPQLPVKEIKPTDLLVVEGLISPYGVVLWRQATHKLITPDNKVYFLKGNRKSLNSLNYHKVKVSGKLISPASENPIIRVDIIEALS